MPFRVFAFLSGSPEPWGMENETLGARIRRLREARRWTQPEMADLLDVSAKTISNWESGRNHPRGSMGALKELFGPALDGAEADSDPVIDAIDHSELTRANKAKLKGAYFDMLDTQEGRRGA